MPVCTVCRGTDFFCDSGYYYCSECQTQYQDLREEVVEGNDWEEQPRRKKRKRSSVLPKAPQVVEENMTSWEGYNFALVGLVNELISLGVNPSFKKLVLKLWSTYLAKLEVAFTSKTEPALPKLGPNYKHYDAYIIYGYSERKEKQEEAKQQRLKDKKKNAHDELLDDSASGEYHVDKLKNLKRKRVAFQMDCDRSMNEMSLTSQTLTDVTLEMLSTSQMDEEEGTHHLDLEFTAEGEKHKGKYLIPSMHPGVLSRSKLLVILYLALLISREKVKLSDLLRWTQEEHLSYINICKLLPSMAKAVGETASLFGVAQRPPAYEDVLTMTQQFSHFIGVKVLKAPQLSDLIKHYTTQLNLPAQVCLLAQRLLALLPEQRQAVIVSVKDKIPNWEGIAMSHIIIALKILFGLDGCTENRNSRVAQRINRLIAVQHGTVKLFVWEDWVKFCTLRKTAFMLLHDRSYIESNLPTSAIQNIKPALSAWGNKWESKEIRSGEFLRKNEIFLAHLQAVSRLQNKSSDCASDIPLNFAPSLSPNSHYTETILCALQNGQLQVPSGGEWANAVNSLNHDILSENFSSSVIDYLTHPERYVEWAQQHGLRVGLHNGSAATTIKCRELKKNPNFLTFSNKQTYRVKAILEKVEGLPSPNLSKTSRVTSTITVQNRSFSCHKPVIYPRTDDTIKESPLPTVMEMQNSVSQKPDKSFKKGLNVTKKCKIENSSCDKVGEEDEDNMLHTPHSEYWMLHFLDLSKDEWSNSHSYDSHRNLLPASFLFLLEECAALLEMKPFVLYREVTNLEVLHKDLSIFSKEVTEDMSFYNLEKYGKERCVSHLKQNW